MTPEARTSFILVGGGIGALIWSLLIWWFVEWEGWVAGISAAVLGAVLGFLAAVAEKRARLSKKPPISEQRKKVIGLLVGIPGFFILRGSQGATRATLLMLIGALGVTLGLALWRVSPATRPDTGDTDSPPPASESGGD